MSREVDADLYDFLKECELGLYKKNDEVIAFVHIDFNKLKRFVDIVGYSYFTDDGGIKVIMQDDDVCIDLNDIFERNGHNISNYKNCFYEDDYRQYKEEILKMEE